MSRGWIRLSRSWRLHSSFGLHLGKRCLNCLLLQLIIWDTAAVLLRLLLRMLFHLEQAGYLRLILVRRMHDYGIGGA